MLDPDALETAKTLWSLGFFECNRVKIYGNSNYVVVVLLFYNHIESVLSAKLPACFFSIKTSYIEKHYLL